MKRKEGSEAGADAGAAQEPSCVFVKTQYQGDEDLRGFIDFLHHHDINNYIDLPEIAVMGDTSSGKSSLLSAISQIQLPSNDQLTTRCPLRLRMEKSETVKAQLEIKWHFSSKYAVSADTGLALYKNQRCLGSSRGFRDGSKANTCEAGANPVGAPSAIQQIALMNTLMLQMKDLNDRVVEAEAASEKAVAQLTATAQSGDGELKALRKLSYMPHVARNPSPPSPSTLESDMLQMYDLYNAKTRDALSKPTGLSMRYEQLVVVPSLSYLHDIVAYTKSTLDWIEDTMIHPTERSWHGEYLPRTTPSSVDSLF
ncbi:hypothetical protein CYMTET_42714 [Cymbomonas tetramitiformis]|uniref:Dynamin N-terminal domain-containing protein n=1 Tax=Cymbomonas tetramitiformis TaxID=36881 RepID=A0AAE0C4Q1_9CHLO|nr:hypothetical protein CYMTET_42714 [Cymbomonas tetramitiformis]